MSKWLVRGLVFAALMVIVRLVQGTLINQFETQAVLISLTLLAVYVAAVFIWGLFDGRSDARANTDPDKRFDFAMTWLIAGLIAGLVSGAVSWLISLVYKSLYVGGVISELTTFAAFTALLIFLPAVLAVAIGRWLVDRNAPEVDRKAAAADERADTDVFAAVRDDTPTGEIPVTAQEESQSSAVAVAERDDETAPVTAEHTEEIPPAERKET